MGSEQGENMTNDKNFIPKLYSTNCPLCTEAKMLLLASGMLFEVIHSRDKIQEVAVRNNMTSLPIAEVSEDIYLCGQGVINHLKRLINK